MAKIINLRTRRKQNTRAANRKAGDENAALNGRSKAEIAVSKARADKSRRDLDGHQRQPDKSS